MRIVAVILIILSLLGCSAPAAQPTPAVQSAPPPVSGDSLSSPPAEPALEEEEPAIITFTLPKGLDPKRTAEFYLEQLYVSYIELKPIDLSPIAVLSENRMMKNLETWNNLLALRRKLIFEHELCFVDRERKPYSVRYIEEKELSDQRMDYIDLSSYGEGAVALHFIIKGTEGKVYPPLFALNSEHSVVLVPNGGGYSVAYHYFPGSEGKFENDLDVEMLTEAQMMGLLAVEFTETELSPPAAEHERVYNPTAAVDYALTYCEERNPQFHFVGDWYGNCMNFVSQSIWAGFAGEGDTPRNYGGMTNYWYCGKKGGTLIWASVSRFWEWSTKETSAMQVYPFAYVHGVKSGDIVNVSSRACEERGKFTHALFVVDEEKLILAQNSPACFVYYSDLVNCDFRFLRPISLNA